MCSATEAFEFILILKYKVDIIWIIVCDVLKSASLPEFSLFEVLYFFIFDIYHTI